MALTNTQYDLLIREYDQRKLRNETAADERIAYINENVPGYRQLGDEIASLGSRALERLLGGDKAALDDINEKIDALSEKRAALLKEAGYPEDYIKVRYDCPDCSDTGYINGRKCHCLKQKIVNILYSQSHISELLEEDNFSTLSYDYYKDADLDRFRAAADAARIFADDFDKDYQNLLFCGTVGTGKSFLSCCIAKQLLDSGHCVIYFSAIELFERLSDIMFDRGDPGELMSVREDLYNCDLLIIDDLGTELTNNAVAAELFSLLNERHLLHRSTVISTNLSLEDLKDRYEDRIFSRIAQRYNIYRISGPDIRRIKKTGQNRIRKE
ncbi:MAG: ATP-binding protein [Lachnospiraceae bacterium]|nr:ATP-binding protein [Lachnospiraceae bacterium]